MISAVIFLSMSGLSERPYKEYFGPKAEPFENMRDAYAPLVWHCRYGGIQVPDGYEAPGHFGRARVRVKSCGTKPVRFVSRKAGLRTSLM